MGTSTSKRLPDFDASETGRVQEKPGVVDLSHVVRRALEIAEHLRNQQSPDGSTVEFDTDLGEGCLVDGYETELFEVLAEALKSATEALTEGGRISLVSKADQGRVTLELRLNRAGASAEDPDREFDTFRNLEDAETGFAASRRVVERHGGTISAARGALGGSERRVVELPLSAQAGGPGNPAADREIVILLVDDVPAIVNIFEMGLKKYNQRTLVAHSAEDALKLYTENHVDAIVSDLVMPEINGAQFAGEVKRICEEKQRPKTPFILVTGWGGDERDEQGFADAGIDAVMEKPIDMARLMDTLTELLRPT
jgi:CheY-like chemotaxis protein